MSAPTVGLVKVAVVRAESDIPMGFPAPCYLNCPCGAKPATDWVADVQCPCGKVYSGSGWAR